MQINIDWLSFTGKRTVGDGDTEQKALADVFTYLDEIDPVILDVMNVTDDWKWDNGRKPYRASFRRPDFGMSIYVHPNLPHFLIEITGKGCASLGEDYRAPRFLEKISERLTRLDLACDMLTDTRPLDFVAQRVEGRFKAHSEVVSETGETCYIGSRSSNRYARVYRYNEPHERAHLLRVEYVVKAEDAKLTAQAIIKHDPYIIAKSLGEQYGWKHPVWSVDAPTEDELRAYRPERRQGKTLFWLNDTVAKLIVKLHREGTIDASEWFATNVLHNLEGNDTL